MPQLIQPKEVLFFPNGNTAVFDEDDQQIPELQESWLRVFVEFLESKSVDPLKCRFQMPGRAIARLFKTEEGRWNWRFD